MDTDLPIELDCLTAVFKWNSHFITFFFEVEGDVIILNDIATDAPGVADEPPDWWIEECRCAIADALYVA